MSPIVYARNRLAGGLALALERLARGIPLAGVHAERWETAALPAGRVAEHPQQGGLLLLRRAATPDGVAALRALVAASVRQPRQAPLQFKLAAADREVALLRQQRAKQLAGSEPHIELGVALGEAIASREALRSRAEAAGEPMTPPLRTRTHWEWFQYEPARFMAPMLPHPDDSASRSASTHARLEESLRRAPFEVFDRAPLGEWLGLRELEAGLSRADDEACEARRGVETLRALTRDLARTLATGASAVLDPVFVQCQLLQRGVAIASHLDAPDPPADVVATLALGDGTDDTVRVGGVVVPLSPGDLYALRGPARWDVEHEVHASRRDRLSLTFRFVET